MLPWSRFRSEDGEGFQLSSHLRGNADSEAPRLPEGAQVEGGNQHRPFGRHVGKAAQQEPPSPLLLFDDSENRPGQLLSQPVHLLGLPSLHPGTMLSRYCIARLQFQATSLAAVLCADSEGWTLPAAVPAPLCYACSGRSAGFVPWASNNSRCPRRR